MVFNRFAFLSIFDLLFQRYLPQHGTVLSLCTYKFMVDFLSVLPNTHFNVHMPNSKSESNDFIQFRCTYLYCLYLSVIYIEFEGRMFSLYAIR